MDVIWSPDQHAATGAPKLYDRVPPEDAASPDAFQAGQKNGTAGENRRLRNVPESIGRGEDDLGEREKCDHPSTDRPCKLPPKVPP
jgi:hypothetical protein